MLSLVAIAGGQPPSGAKGAQPQDSVFRFRALGPTNNVRAELAAERQWQMRSGITLAGRALVSPRSGCIEIERVNHNGPGPIKVIAELPSFSDADRTTLTAAFPAIKPEARMLGLLVPFSVEPQWSKAQPIIAKRYTRAVAVEANHVIFRSGDELYLVPKAAFTPASYSKIAEQFQAKYAGRFVRLNGYLGEVAGKLLLELEADFLFEAVYPPLMPNTVLSDGQRFRVPKHWMTPEQIEDLQQLIKRFPSRTEVEIPSSEQLVMMTSLRLLKGMFAYCNVDVQERNVSLLAYDAVGKTHREPMHQLTNRDHVAISRELEIEANPSNPKNISEFNGFLKAVAATYQTEWWLCGPGRVAFSGRFVGKLGSIYCFRQTDDGPFFYVLPQDLSELDRKILEGMQRNQETKWTQNVDLVDLLSRRLLPNNGHAFVVWLGSKTMAVDSAVRGTIPIVGRSAETELPWPELDLANIREIERSRKFSQEYQATLASGDLSQVIPAIVKSFEPSPTPASSAVDNVVSSSPANAHTETPSAPNAAGINQLIETLPKRDNWKKSNSYDAFIGELVGEYENDWVFMERVNGENKYFLASPDILAPEARKKGEAALGRIKKQSWDERLAVADNWQLFRVWHDPNGKVRTPSGPSVVLSISESLMRFESLDGSQHSDRSPGDEAELQAVVEFYQPAIDQAKRQKSRAEESLMVWKFRDCESTLRAALIGESSDDFLVRDAKNVQFLINKVCLDPASLADVQIIRSANQTLQSLTNAEAQSMPRVWCTRTKLIGPAKPIYLTFDDQLEIVLTNGQHNFIKLSNLTLREQLSFEKQWRKDHGQLEVDPQLATSDNAHAVDAVLKAAIPQNEIIISQPELRADIREAIDANLSKWQNPTWSSTPVKLKSNARLLAVNADARFGVVDEDSQGWAIVELASGKQKTIRTQANRASLNPSATTDKSTKLTNSTEPNQQLCWMFRDARVYWIEEGKVYVSGNKPSDAAPVSSLTLPIVAASQSTDYASLVLRLADASTYRFDLANHEVKQLSPAQTASPQSNVIVIPNSGAATDGAQQRATVQSPPPTQSTVWASSDGTAFTAFAGNMVQFHVPSQGEDDQARLAFLGTSKPVLHATCNRDAALIQTDETGLLSMMVASVTSPAPRRLGMPFNPRWFGIVKWIGGPEENIGAADKELIQFIGKPADTFFAESGYFFAHQVSLNTDYKKYAYQYVLGEMNEHLRVAANGSAIVHHREGKYVVSRRPTAIPVILPATFSAFIEQLVAQRDIGQLESLGRYLDQPKFHSIGPYAGWIGLQYAQYVKLTCFQYQPNVGGDRLERSIVLAEHLLRKYPASQVAGNVLVDIHRELAWSARGGGYADTVTETGIETFRTEMGLAREQVEELMEAPDPMAVTFQSAIDVSMATTDSLDGPREIAVRLLRSPHVTNSQLHHLMALLLLPRWHGTPGASEAYMQKAASSVPNEVGKAMYVQQIALLMPVLGYEIPVTSQLQVDLQTMFQGTKEYYKHRTDSDLLDRVIMILAVEKKYDWIRELLKLRAEKRMMPSATAAINALSFRNIEERCGK